jgi:hypothetical protein
MKNPQMVADKWATNLGNAGTSITAGVNATTVAPTQLAAAAVDRQVQGVMRAAQSGKTAAALNAVTLQQWQQAMIQKGVPRIGTGAAAAKPKFVSFMNQLLPFEQQGLQQLPARGDVNANIQRMVAWAQYMSTFRKQ